MSLSASFYTTQMSYRLGKRTLLESLDLKLYQNELTVIIGPNGAGKSTLLRLLTGYLTPTAGACYFLNKSLAKWEPKKLAQHRSVMSQQSSFSFPFTAQQIITMGCSPYPFHQHQTLLEKSVQFTETQSLLKIPYLSLSGGEQQRIQFARAIAQLGLDVQKPHYFFLDEPTSALDLGHQQKMLRLLKKLAKERNLGVCCILHDLNLAALYADRIIVLHHGRCVAYGATSEVFQEVDISNWYQAQLNIKPHPHYPVPHLYLAR